MTLSPCVTFMPPSRPLTLIGLRSHYVASVFAAKTMIKSRNGSQPRLIINISSAAGLGYVFDVAYGVGKAEWINWTLT